MKPSRELIEHLSKLTFDREGYPFPNEQVIGVSVGTLRWLVSNLQYQLKEPYREDGKNFSTESTLFKV
jgi:hypothetical protein